MKKLSPFQGLAVAAGATTPTGASNDVIWSSTALEWLYWNGSAWVPFVKEFWCRLASDFTLTSTTGEQKLFNSSTNGALTLPIGVYFFDSLLFISSMSTTSGNGSFDVIGAGTAVVDKILYELSGVDQTNAVTTPQSRTGSGSVTQQTGGSNMLIAAGGSALIAKIDGTFTVTTGGTIIPSIGLTTAAAAVVGAGSYFRCVRMTETDIETEGPWS